MIVGILFLCARAVELFFLIPIIGMLSYLVNGYVKTNQLTPTFVLVLFIVSTIAGVWAFFTMVFYAAAKHNGYFLWFVDLCVFGGLIAGVYLLRGVSTQDCSSLTLSVTNSFLYNHVGVWVNEYSPKVCNLLKASFALGIMEIIFFFWTSFLALWVHHHHRRDYQERSKRSERHYSRHSHRRGGGSSSRSRAGGAADGYYGDNTRRSGSRSRSQYRTTRSYV